MEQKDKHENFDWNWIFLEMLWFRLIGFGIVLALLSLLEILRSKGGW